jgi:hypothetical protein
MRKDANQDPDHHVDEQPDQQEQRGLHEPQPSSCPAPEEPGDQRHRPVEEQGDRKVGRRDPDVLDEGIEEEEDTEGQP